ncbi:hypothetical protein Mal4_35680 [Maioricimonas rarisocia]|uniref:Peptidase C-terminal archaeal/bacterial domain-containing protein n=1 Tax=Maioricimonas rarisocia TaxID=2528026 RepID=A0A517Z9W0_9PLAN|nr:PPC domain-containing protein [Maioricimonas rarisocia]QDU39231.1 hypothetical protein Mal4_35680 [Maioricimonas rarisocia]
MLRALICRPALLSVFTWFLLGTLPLHAQLPQTRLYSISPPGAQIGTTAEVRILAGDDLEEISALHFNHPGITAEPKMQEVNGQPQPVDKTFVVKVAPDVPPGMYDVRTTGLWGTSNPRRFVVGTLPEVIEAETNNTPDQASPLELNTVLNGRMDGGTDVDIFRTTLTAGQKVVIDCQAQRIDSRMDPTIEVYDSTGRQRLGVSRNDRGRDAVLVYEVPQDGEYLVRVFDHVYRNGNDYFYRLKLHTGPHLAYSLPASGLPGTTSRFALYGVNLPGGQPTDLDVDGVPLERLETDIAIPKLDDLPAMDHRVDSVHSSVDGFSYRFESPEGQSNPLRIFLSSAPALTEAEPNDAADAAQSVAVPCEITGQFGSRADQDVFTFEAKAGQVYWIEAFGQRLGTSADPYVVVEQITVDGNGNEQAKRLTAQDDTGTNLLQNVFDTHTDDPAWRLQIPADGKYRVTIRDRYWESRGNPSLIYRLAIREEQPDFRLVLVPAAPTAGQTWPVGLRQGDNFAVNVLAFRRDGFAGPVRVTAENLPEGLQCPGTTIGEKDNSTLLTLTTTDGASAGTQAVRITGSAWVDDPAAVKQEEAARAALDAANKALPDLRKAADEAAKKVTELTNQRDAARKASEEKPDDEGLKQKLAQAEQALEAAQKTQQEAAGKLAAGEKSVADATAALQAAEKARQDARRELKRMARAGTVVWSQQGNNPAEARLADDFVLSVMPEASPFQVKTDVFEVDANQSRQILVPMDLVRRDGFDEQVKLTVNGLPKNANIDVKADAIDKGRGDQLVRIFVKDNAPPGTYTIWLQSQAQVNYRRNPQKAERLKQAFDAATAAAEAAKKAQAEATAAKNKAIAEAKQAAEALTKLQAEQTKASQQLQAAQAELKKSQEALKQAQTAAANAAEALKSAETSLADARTAAEADAENEDLKQTVAQAEQAVQEATTAKQKADEAATAAAKSVADTEQAVAKANEQSTSLNGKVAEAEKTKTAADQAQKAATDAEAQATQQTKTLEEARKAAEKQFQDAEKAAQPKKVNFTPPSTPVVITVHPAPVKLAAGVPGGGALKRGAAIEIKVTVTRQNGFTGPVQLTLPENPVAVGLAADPVTIPADQTEGVLKITAAGDATLGQLENMVIRATMDFDGKAAVDVPVTLKVAE